MRVLVACEFTGIVREAFRARGHYAVSVDLLPTEIPGKHIQGDVLEVLEDRWDIMLAFPPCRFLARSGLHWNSRITGRAEQTEQALDFVVKLLNAPIKKICLENPQGAIGTRIRVPTQIIHPHQYGHRESKTTCLWLKNLPLLRPTKRIILRPGEQWDNCRPDGQHHRPQRKGRSQDASRTYPGIAEAMAEQWG